MTGSTFQPQQSCQNTVRAKMAANSPADKIFFRRNGNKAECRVLNLKMKTMQRVLHKPLNQTCSSPSPNQNAEQHSTGGASSAEDRPSVNKQI